MNCNKLILIWVLFWCPYFLYGQQQANIIWISCEDISPYLAAYGDSTATTPHIDALASEGVVYENAFAVAGVCAPSRSGIITGMYPTYLGTNHMRTGRDITGWGKQTYWTNKGVVDVLGENVREYSAVIPEEVKCFPEYLRAAGYFCSNNAKTDYQFAAPLSAWDENDGKAHWCNRAPEQPFFAVFNFNETHESKLWAHQELPLTVAPASVKVPPYFPDHETVRKDIARQYSNIMLMDQRVGEIIEQLKADDLYDDAYIFFFSDHGGALPRSKREVMSSGLKVPLIIKYPAGHRNTGRSERLTSFLDLAPTVLEMAGVQPPEHLQGESILSGGHEYVFAARDRMDETTVRRRMVTDGRWLLIQHQLPEASHYQEIQYRYKVPTMKLWKDLYENGKLNSVQENWFQAPEGEWELYDLKRDPYEIHNLAGDPVAAKEFNRLAKALKGWQEQIPDRCRQPESQLIAEMWPGGIQPKTEVVSAKTRGGKWVLQCPTPGASIIWREAKGKWQLYHEPLELKGASALEVKAVRIGYQDSEISLLCLQDDI